MSAETDAVDALASWMNARSMKPNWERIIAGGSAGFDIGLHAPHAALLLATDGEWFLHLATARGTKRSPLGAIMSAHEVLIDALLFAIFTKATSELDHTDRTASAQLSTVLRVLADESHDARYSGRAAMLLAGHAIKDGYELQARSRLEEAIRLFRTAGDITAADTAASALESLPELMAS